VNKDVRIRGYFFKTIGSASKKVWETLELGCGLDKPGSSTQQQGKFYIFSVSYKLAVECEKPPSQWVMVAPFMEEQWPGCEADHSTAYSGEVKKELTVQLWLYAFMVCVQTASLPVPTLYKEFRMSCVT